MVVVNAIEVDGIKKPETLPNTNFGNFSDGEKFYFFENEQEILQFKSVILVGTEIAFDFEQRIFYIKP
jgi:hypothetical protein